MQPDEPDEEPTALDEALEGLNAGYVAELYAQYRVDPMSVELEWRRRFDRGEGGFEPVRMAAQTPEIPLPGGATPLRGPAGRLATNMTASLAVPTATTFRKISVATLVERRRALNLAIAPRRMSFTHLIGWAIVRAVNEQPVMNRSYAESGGQPHRVDPASVNLGLAVDVEKSDGSRSLVVPVIRGADNLDFAAYLDRYETLVAGARSSSLGPDDYAGATITLTNPGTLGTTASVPRLMPGQGCIVACGAIRTDPPPARMTLTSTYDHRVIQGAESGAFLARVEALLAGADGFYGGIAGALGTSASPPSAPPQAAVADGPAVTVSGADLGAMAAAKSLIDAYRAYGHLAATLDPLGSPPPGDPALDPANHGLTPAVLARIPADLLGVHVPGDTAAEVFEQLRATYSGTIAYEVEHLANHEERRWLREAIESGAHRTPLTPEAQRTLLARLTAAETLEQFLHKAYLGQKRFSIEGLDALVPMLDLAIEEAAAGGTHRAVIGMAHRGRLNVLAHTVGMGYDAVIAEFEAGRGGAAPGEADDVKYHLGAEGTHVSPSGAVAVSLMPNPSHLEAIGPVVEGRARAEQSDRSGRTVVLDAGVTMPILIHGDAAFAAQGVVAETFNLSRLAGYRNGGTLHFIANNQVGFTTAVDDARSTTYSSDLAKGFDVPIIHVNADDPEACLAGVRLAMAYRARFDADVVIDLVGYRRYGHNETDEPAYTQPTMYRAIADHPSVRTSYLATLISAGVVTAEAAESERTGLLADLAVQQAAVRRSPAESGLDRGSEALTAEATGEPATAVAADVLRTLNAELTAIPHEFSPHPRLASQIARRREAFDAGQPSVDWGHAEGLAFASLLTEGVPIRLTGQDTVRGTFSQRHQTLFDTATGTPYTPIQNLSTARASFEAHNSPLSEYACLGFEYGYAVSAPEALVLWEAQFGDFANGAEIIIDQFVIAGLAKWRQTSRLTLLLPHGYEGQGPEHSSARLERFLALGAEGNIRVAYPTTASQYFHLLRRQGLHPELRPLVVMTPKSLLRLPEAASSLSDLSGGSWASVLDDPQRQTQASAAAVRRIVLCSGKVYYDLALSAQRSTADSVALVRVEQLYPFPTEALGAVLARYPAAEKVSWVQEEPRNMGARKFVLPKIRHLVPYQIPLGDISRPERSRPAEGYPAAHAAEQARIVEVAFAG